MFILLLFLSVSANDLFAGNGIATYSYSIYGEKFNMNCTTYDECHYLLCNFLSNSTLYLKIIEPNYWTGNCSQLNSNDNRTLAAFLDVYNINNKLIIEYIVSTISHASQILCKLGQNKSISKIEYIGPFNC
jgi:hypothetical protein